MLTLKALRVHFLLIILLIAGNLSVGQTLTNDDADMHLIDSLLESLSIAEKINQLILLQLDASPVDSTSLYIQFGSVLSRHNDPTAHLEFVRMLGKRDISMPLVFAGMSDREIAIDMDSLVRFGSYMTFSAVAEPHLIYETGKALAAQCRILGIDGLLSPGSESTSGLAQQLDWRLQEINQGLQDQGALTIDHIPVETLENIELVQFLNQDSLALLMLDAADISIFQEYAKSAIDTDSIDELSLDEKVKQIMAMKLARSSAEDLDPVGGDLLGSLTSPQNKLLEEELAASSITILKNESQLLPIRSLENKQIASLSIGKTSYGVFSDYLDNYTTIDHYQIDYTANDEAFADLWTKLTSYDLVICDLYDSEFISTRILEAQSLVVFLEWLNDSEKAIIAYFGDPKTLQYENNILKSPTLLLCYERDELNSRLVPQTIFGAREASGILPLTINNSYKKGAGQSLDMLGRFSYSIPESVGLDGVKLRKIDTLVAEAIRARAIPGCQVLVARNNCIVYKNSFGYHTYDSLRSVADDDLYDLASITKVSGALPGLMKLYEEGKFDLDAAMGTYLRYFKRGKKKKLHHREILAHQAGLIPWIPYWKTTIRRNGKYRRKTLSTTISEDFPYGLTDSLFVYKDYKKKIYKQIRKSKVGEKKYLYSGVTFYIYPDIIEEITRGDYYNYVRSNFYEPLGASTLTYNPMNQFDLDRIVPTEYDSLFRKTQIHGRVHDEGAAMMQGISSNAGLFATANDLAKLFQMYCNYGSFGGREYLKKETVIEFTRCQFPENNNRRALGFDRPLPQPHENGNTSKSASQKSFGHTGFTGTFAWADPEYDLVYIFLSNRVYPTRENTKLYDMNVRTNIQEVIYQSMID